MDLSDRESEVRDHAIQEVAKMLVSADALSNIKKFSEEYTLKKAAIENNLSTLAHSRIEDARLSLVLLDTQLLFVNFRSDFASIDQFAEQSRKSISDESIRTLFEKSQNAKTNVRSVLETAAHLVHLPTEIERLRDSFADENRLLDTYVKLRELMAVKESFNASISENQKKKQFLELLEEVDRLVDEFYNHVLRTIMAECLDYAENAPNILVKVVRILVDCPVPTNVKNTKGNTDASQMWCFDVWQAWLKSQILGCEGDLDKQLNLFRDVFYSVQNYVELCFPREWRVLDKFVMIAHCQLVEVIDNLKAPLLGTGANELTSENVSILELIGFLRSYASELQVVHDEAMRFAEEEGDDDRMQHFSVPDVTPIVEELESFFLSKIGDKLREWIHNLFQQERNDEKTLEERDEDGKIQSTFPAFLFRMLHQQMGLARRSQNEEIERKVAVTCVEMLVETSSLVSDALLLNPTNTYSLEHLCAFCNNNVQLNEYSQEFCEMYATSLESFGDANKPKPKPKPKSKSKSKSNPRSKRSEKDMDNKSRRRRDHRDDDNYDNHDDDGDDDANDNDNDNDDDDDDDDGAYGMDYDEDEEEEEMGPQGWEVAYDEISASWVIVKDAALKKLVDTVMNDILPVFSAGPIHFSDSEQRWNSLCATLEDFYGDLDALLFDNFLRTLSHLLLHKVCFFYLFSMLTYKAAKPSLVSFDFIESQMNRLHDIFGSYLKEQVLDKELGQLISVADLAEVQDGEEVIYTFRELLKDYPDVTPLIVEKLIANWKEGVFDKKVRNESNEMCKEYFNKMASLPDYEQKRKDANSIFGMYISYINGEVSIPGLPDIRGGKKETKKEAKKEEKKDEKKDEKKVESKAAAAPPQIVKPGGKAKDKDTGVEVMSLSDLLKG
eukprot:ANDGO_03015.mRNA.1 Exocyst complex component SEC6